MSVYHIGVYYTPFVILSVGLRVYFHVNVQLSIVSVSIHLNFVCVRLLVCSVLCLHCVYLSVTFICTMSLSLFYAITSCVIYKCVRPSVTFMSSTLTVRRTVSPRQFACSSTRLSIHFLCRAVSVCVFHLFYILSQLMLMDRWTNTFVYNT